jgi:uncharacterized SAM-binding protein YcdF (DUF218 family)
MKKSLYAAAIGLLMAASIWLMGLVWFVSTLPSPHQLQVSAPAQAIAVWTGGAGRIEKGLDLLLRGKGRYLLISGVYRNADKSEIFSDFRRRNPASWQRVQGRISLGKDAKDTQGNAHETARWMQRNRFTSLHLVTASYHMPRSLYEIGQALPQAVIIPAPVFNEGFLYGHWWQDKDALTLVLSEYHKLVATATYHLLRR